MRSRHTGCRAMLLIAAAQLSIPVAMSDDTLDRTAEDRLVFMSSGDPAMRKAFESARSSLDDFLKLASSPPPGTSVVSVKIGLTLGAEVEYFWIHPFFEQGDHFVGVLDNEPRIVKNYEKGQTILFRKNQIVDWTYTDASQRMHGNFTACALLTKETPEVARRFQETYRLSCE